MLEEDPIRCSSSHGKPCHFAGRPWPSRASASRLLEVPYPTFNKWINDGLTDYPDYYKEGKGWAKPSKRETAKIFGHLKIYMIFHKRIKRLKYVGRTFQPINDRMTQHWAAAAEGGRDTLLAKAMRGNEDDYDYVVLKEYPEITRQTPNYGDLGKAKEGWWISRKKSSTEHGGLNDKPATCGDTGREALNAAQQKEVVGIYKKGQDSMSKIGREFKVSCHVIRRVLLKHGITPAGRGAAQTKYAPYKDMSAARKYSDEQRAQARRLYMGGKYAPEIARAMGVSIPWVRTITEDLPRHPRWRRVKPAIVNSIRRDRERGEFVEDIAAKHNVSGQFVCKVTPDIDKGNGRFANVHSDEERDRLMRRICELRDDGRTWDEIEEITECKSAQRFGNEGRKRGYGKATKTPTRQQTDRRERAERIGKMLEQGMSDREIAEAEGGKFSAPSFACPRAPYK